MLIDVIHEMLHYFRGKRACVVVPVRHASAIEFHESQHQPPSRFVSSDVAVIAVCFRVPRQSRHARLEDGIAASQFVVKHAPRLHAFRCQTDTKVAIRYEKHVGNEIGRHSRDEVMLLAIEGREIHRPRSLFPLGLAPREIQRTACCPRAVRLTTWALLCIWKANGL